MDDMSGKINDFLSNPESMNMIKNLIGMLGSNGGGAGDGGGEQRQEKHEDAKSTNQGGGFNMDDIPFDAATMMKMKRAFEMLRKDDPRVAFLLALKPNLSEDRCKRVDQAIHLLRLMNLIPLLQEGILN